MTRSQRISFLVVLSLLAAACRKPATGQAEAASSGRPPVAVETARVTPSELQQSIDVVGALAARSEAEIKAEYSGNIAEIYVTQWVQVSKGKPLARLDTRESEAAVQAARAQTLQAEVAAQRTARELERTQKLKQAGLSTQQGLDEARTADEAARAAAASARAELGMAETRLAKAVIRAPIDGVVAARNVNVGDHVENMGGAAAMFRIVDNRVLELTASVPSARMAELKVGQPFTFSTDALPGKEFTGKVSFINPVADEASRTIKVKAEVANSGEELKAGLFVKGRVITGNRTGVLAVPRASLVSWDTAGHTGSVFVVEGGVARLRNIQTGASPGDSVEVVGGLSAGAEIVIRGGFNLRDGDRVRTAEGV